MHTNKIDKLYSKLNIIFWSTRIHLNLFMQLTSSFELNEPL